MLRILKRAHGLRIIDRKFHVTKQRPGYIVLVPEIGEDQQAGDGLLLPNGLPAFDNITIENCLGAIGAQANAVEESVASIEKRLLEKTDVSLATLFHEFDATTGPLDTTWGIAKALYLGNCTLIPTKTYMNIHERARKARASKYNSPVIYNALQEVAGTAKTSNEEERLVQKFLLEGKLNGLSKLEQRDELHDIISKLSQERASFKNKVSTAVASFSHKIDDIKLVQEFPLQFLETIAATRKQATAGPWQITLHPQVVENFLKYCPDRLQRWNVWFANVSKCSGMTERSLENSTHLEKIRDLRQRQAKLLGFKNFAEMSMQTKMVGDIKKLHAFFANLLQHAGPAQLVETAKLQNFAVDQGFQHQLELYDVPFWQQKQLRLEHNYKEQQLRDYFPLSHVLKGVISLCEELFQIKIVQRKDVQVWQPAVQYYDVIDLASGQKPIAGFYIDCYSREKKFTMDKGWMVSIRNRNEAAAHVPLSALIFNFTQPKNNADYLLGFEELRMLFYTFGTAMQHLLTQVNYTDLAGISNIEWDASQVVGNVMSNFLDNPNVLQRISRHIKTNDLLPDALAGTGRLLKQHLAGYRLCQQIYLSHLDIELHEKDDYWLDIVKKLWPVYNCMPLDKKDAHPCSMNEIFSGDWAAAYYSHLYAQMLAADITEEFENSADYCAVGKRFRDTYLSLGGSLPASEVFRRFRGRDHSVEPLLRALNIHHPTQTSES